MHHIRENWTLSSFLLVKVYPLWRNVMVRFCLLLYCCSSTISQRNHDLSNFINVIVNSYHLEISRVCMGRAEILSSTHLGWIRKVWLWITIFSTSFSISLSSFFLGGKRKGELSSKNRDQKSYLSVPSHLGLEKGAL